MNAQHEYNTQVALVNYLRVAYPKALYCGSAGGMYTNKVQYSKMKASGYVKGFPDLFIYEPRGIHHGLAIELKWKEEPFMYGSAARGGKSIRLGKPTPEQKQWIESLNARGYVAGICYGFDEARKMIDNYLKQTT